MWVIRYQAKVNADIVVIEDDSFISNTKVIDDIFWFQIGVEFVGKAAKFEVAPFINYTEQIFIFKGIAETVFPI